MPTLAVLVLAAVAASSSGDAPLRVGGIRAAYCPNEDLVELVVENVSGVALLVSLSVERLEPSGEWAEFSSDVLGTQRYPMKVFTIPLAAKSSRRIRWRPRVNSNERAWVAGSYRVVAHWLVERRPAGQAVVAELVVRQGPRCSGGTEREQSRPPAAGADGLDACLEEASTQRAMEGCAHGALVEARKTLEALYRGHLEQLERDEKAAKLPEDAEDPARARRYLQESQDFWLEYREANCNLQAAKVWEGSMVTAERELCHVRMTRDRVEEIRRAFTPP